MNVYAYLTRLENTLRSRRDITLESLRLTPTTSSMNHVFRSHASRGHAESSRHAPVDLTLSLEHMLHHVEENPQHEENYLAILDRQLIAGVILAPAPGTAQHLLRFIEGGLPIVLINRRLDHLPCSSVTSDDEEAAFQCVSHLIEEGRRRIAAVTGLPGVFTTRERLHGYHRALAAADLPVDSTLEVSGQARLEGGYKAVYELMQRVNPPDALFVFNNLMTQGVVMALQDLGLRWPDQVDVAGFGAFGAARLYRPPLTLIAQPAHEMGKCAVEMLVDQVEGRGGNQPQAVVLHNRLIPREAWLRPDGRRVFPG